MDDINCMVMSMTLDELRAAKSLLDDQLYGEKFADRKYSEADLIERNRAQRSTFESESAEDDPEFGTASSPSVELDGWGSLEERRENNRRMAGWRRRQQEYEQSMVKAANLSRNDGLDHEGRASNPEREERRRFYEQASDYELEAASSVNRRIREKDDLAEPDLCIGIGPGVRCPLDHFAMSVDEYVRHVEGPSTKKAATIVSDSEHDGNEWCNCRTCVNRRLENYGRGYQEDVTE